ncbi:hypothetical protein QJS66_06135 [Kocuria rhizophila]|nr:hypothetical protein QJS66_06135 [Kocuria rhizophila]
MNGQIALVISTFLRVVVLAFVVAIVILLIQYEIAGVVARRNPLVMLKTCCRRTQPPWARRRRPRPSR